MVAVFSARSCARRVLVSAVVSSLAVVAGCYRYAPVPVTGLTPDMNVRLELSAVAVDRLRHAPDSMAKLLDGFTVSGTVSELRGDSVVLSVPTSYMQANVRLETQMHSLALLRSDLERAQSRRLDRSRTTWTGIAIGILGAGAVAYVLNHGERSTGTTPKPPDTQETLLLPIRLLR
jgi:hypothetical protein